jgi:hypothetical protein
MLLNPDFREFVASFNANGVRYLVAGGYAVALPEPREDMQLPH